MKHRVYQAIITAIKSGNLAEPFTSQDFQNSCPGFRNGTYNTFLFKHRCNNPGGNSELFVKVSPGHFKCVRPFKYGL